MCKGVIPSLVSSGQTIRKRWHSNGSSSAHITATVRPSKQPTGIMARASLPYRSLRVDRPTMASMMAMIQKRITTVDSAQPSLSK